MVSRRKKNAILGILSGLIILLVVGSCVAISVPTIKFHAPSLIFNRYTIYPFRTILEHCGSVVTWDKQRHEITIQKGSNSFNLSITTDQIQGIPIYVDNKYIGKSPLQKRLFAGKYEVVARPAGYAGSIRYLTLKAEDAKDKQIVLPVDQHSYQDFLDEIIRLGYTPIRVMDYYNHVPTTKKTIVLRHDVDVSAEYALKMAEIEQARGIKSSYYFRWSTVDPEVIKKIRAMGHEVGLHYETLAFYSEEIHLKSAQDITAAVQQELRSRLKFEIAQFKQQFGEMYTIASHGADENIRLGVTNYKAIMEGENPNDYGIIGTAYGSITEHFTYMSDVGGIWDPFPYPKLENNEGPFYILIHPIHWATSYSLQTQSP